MEINLEKRKEALEWFEDQIEWIDYLEVPIDKLKILMDTTKEYIEYIEKYKENPERRIINYIISCYDTILKRIDESDNEIKYYMDKQHGKDAIIVTIKRY